MTEQLICSGILFPSPGHRYDKLLQTQLCSKRMWFENKIKIKNVTVTCMSGGNPLNPPPPLYVSALIYNIFPDGNFSMRERFTVCV